MNGPANVWETNASSSMDAVIFLNMGAKIGGLQKNFVRQIIFYPIIFIVNE
jgi:hypothetical protein